MRIERTAGYADKDGEPAIEKSRSPGGLMTRHEIPASWIVLALTLALASGSGCGGSDPFEPLPSDLARIVPASDALPTLAWTRTKVKRGEALDFTLRRLELGPGERITTLRVLRGEVDFRRILPGEAVAIGRDRDGALREVVLQRDQRRKVVARFPPEGEPRAESVHAEPEVRLRNLQGEVSGNLYEAILAAGGNAQLVMELGDLLAWQVDFLTEPRRGDRFRILVEEELLEGKKLGYGSILAAEYRGQRSSARAILYVDANRTRDWFDDAGDSVRRAFLKSPLNFRRISSRFSARRRHPILKTVRPHWGVDYAAPRGTPVSALGSGVVTEMGRRGGYGNYLEIRHNATFTTCYGHLSRFAAGLRRGGRVEQGQTIGAVGSTGLSTGPHLDFRVKRHGKFIDPLRLESPPGRSVPRAEADRFARYRDRVWRLMDRLGPDEAVDPETAWARVPVLPSKEQLLALTP
jgi:murein DD-endopeptidase MepM/ murein hydrolase activator NlpD